MPISPFVVLTIAMVLVWSRRISSSTVVAWAWLIPAVPALVMAAAAEVIELSGVLALIVLGAACGAAANAASPALRYGAHVIMLVVAAG